MNSIGFFSPGNPLHEETGQVNRQKSALKLNVQSVDNTSKTGRINDYAVSLEECSCRDFSLHHKPCKHMYRLAYELGLFSLPGQAVNDASVKNSNEKKKSKAHMIELASRLNDEEKQVLYSVMYEYLYHDKRPTALLKSDVVLRLLDDALIAKTVIHLDALASASRMDVLKDFVRNHNCDIKLKKKSDILGALSSDYVDLFQEYVSQFVFVVPSDSTMLAPRKIYQIVQPPQEDLSYLWK